MYVGIGSTLWWQGTFQVVHLQGCRLGKSIHPLYNINVDPAIRSDNVAKVVIDNGFIGDDVETETHVLGVWHGSVEVDISKAMPKYLAPGVLMVELMSSLAMVRSAAGVLLLPGYSMQLLPTVSLTQCFSSFCGW